MAELAAIIVLSAGTFIFTVLLSYLMAICKCKECCSQISVDLGIEEEAVEIVDFEEAEEIAMTKELELPFHHLHMCKEYDCKCELFGDYETVR